MMTLLFTLIVDRPPHSGWDLNPGICKIWGIFRPPYANFAAGLTDAVVLSSARVASMDTVIIFTTQIQDVHVSPISPPPCPSSVVVNMLPLLDALAPPRAGRAGTVTFGESLTPSLSPLSLPTHLWLLRIQAHTQHLSCG